MGGMLHRMLCGHNTKNRHERREIHCACLCIHSIPTNHAVSIIMGVRRCDDGATVVDVAVAVASVLENIIEDVD